MVLVVVAVGVWNFSSKFQSPSKPVPFSDFMTDVEAGKVEKVTITGQEIIGSFRAETRKPSTPTRRPSTKGLPTS